ncbi:MAG TPA: methionyl-tRNA formyltransferase [Gemmatimonadales bacterium]|nr:methionyl-tRNA formyltransferase [Gemmatimonadales bacterium]
MKLGWVGFHMEGIPALEAVLEAGAPIASVLTLSPEVRASRSGAADYGPVCRRFGVPLHEVTSINDPASRALLQGLDLVFVIGWSQILSPETLATARLGMIGTHASLLPKNRGSAPINWALIRGEQVSGNSLIWLAEGVDAGDIIDQTEFPISQYDTCGTLYERVAASNRDMILRALPRLLQGERIGSPQPRSNGGGAVLPRRRPADGLINWDQEACAVYNFIRGLTKPYPGAFGWLDGRRWGVWRAALLPALAGAAGSSPAPGEVLGPTVSPVEEACGQVVACASGAVTLLEVEGDDGTVYSGRRLSELPWAGRRWSHA